MCVFEKKNFFFCTLFINKQYVKTLSPNSFSKSFKKIPKKSYFFELLGWCPPLIQYLLIFFINCKLFSEAEGAEINNTDNINTLEPQTPNRIPSPPKNNLFLSKPPVKVNFVNQQTAQASKKRKSLDDNESDHQNQTYTDISSNLNKHGVKFENCTFHSCTLKITPISSSDDKENHP